MEHMHLRPPCILLLLIPISACRARSPAGEFNTELETVQSWAATAHMVGEAWTKDTVPIAYTEQTLQTAQQTLQEELNTIREMSAVPIDQRTRALESARHLQQIIRQMQAAIERKDYAAMAEQVKELTTAEQTLIVNSVSS